MEADVTFNSHMRTISRTNVLQNATVTKEDDNVVDALLLGLKKNHSNLLEDHHIHSLPLTRRLPAARAQPAPANLRFRGTRNLKHIPSLLSSLSEQEVSF